MSRVAIFLPSLHGGGAERAMVIFAGEALKLGFDLDIVVVQNVGALREVVPRGARVIDLGCRRMLSALPGLVRYLNSAAPDALFATITHANLLAAVAGRVARHRPRVIVRQSNAPIAERKDRIARLMAYRLIPWLYPWSDAVIAVSQGVGQQLAEIAPQLRSRLEVIPTPVLSSKLIGMGEEPAAHPWLAQGQPPVVLAAGRLEPQKGFLGLIAAFGKVVERRDARLIIIGEGRERTRLEREVQERGLKGRVDLPGFQGNPYAFMSRAQSFVLSSEYEGLPNVLIQAMAFGTPVVATDCESGPAEILEGGRLGTLVPVGDVARLAAAIERSLDAPRQPAAQASVMSRFGAAEASARYLHLAGLQACG